jgi:dihydroorotate dehydrogenase (NAD+) catalytic subunit
MWGAPQPRISEVGHGVGLLNAIGLQNPGLEGFLNSYFRRYEKGELPVPIWVNVFAGTLNGYVEVIEGILKSLKNPKPNWLAGFELNVSCPNVDKGGAEFGGDTATLEKLVRACVATAGPHPVMVKLSPLPSNPVDLAKASLGAGAQALSVANTLLAGFPEPEKRDAQGRAAWVLGRRYGGLSGPALRPIALRILDQIANALPGTALCGGGGIQNAHDAQEFFAAGAQVVQVGTAHFANPWVCDEILASLG